jgi:ParB-like chromosome segregation protein Spo0J
MADIHVGTEVVPLSSLKPYPKNARIGDVQAIAESLEVNGQYRPIVVNKRTNEILAGNHTWKAAKQLGWKKIAVAWVDVDEREAKRIVIADNRTHDLGTYDTEALTNLLMSLPDLDGTGYTEWDLENLEGLFTSPNMFKEEGNPREQTGTIGERAVVEMGYYRALVDNEAFEPWVEQVSKEGNGDKKRIVRILRVRLGLPEQSANAVEREKKTKKAKVAPSDLNLSLQEVEKVDIDLLQPYPMNAREGDVGAISESLRVNGQYRPIVVNKRDNTILVGNHTWLAAKALKWKEIGVAWVDVDDDAAKKIVLADNRTAEMGQYDERALLDLIVSLGSFEGTGYDGDDVDQLISQVNGYSAPEGATGKASMAVGIYRDRLTWDEWTAWEDEIQHSAGYSREEICAEVIRRLNLPSDSFVVTTSRDTTKQSERKKQQ